MSSSARTEQVWELPVAGHRHRVTARGSVSRQVTWHVDEEVVAEKRSSDRRVRLRDQHRPELGAVTVRFSGLGAPRRATLVEPDPEDRTGNRTSTSTGTSTGTGDGGIDLVPAPGSAAAAFEDRVRAHPARHAALATLVGVARVLAPILLGAVGVHVAVSLPWPHWDLPDVPLPSLPSPDLPSIPWPDWRIPGWVAWVADHAGLVWPIVLAFVLARAEVRRRAKQDRLRAERAALAAGVQDGAAEQEGTSTTGPGTAD